MQAFHCPNCGKRAYFDNLTCICGEDLFFDPATGEMRNDAPACGNRENLFCNWAAPADGRFCVSCAMSNVVPNLAVTENVQLLARTERAKRWVLANVARWNWFTPADQGPRPVFRMLSEHLGDRDAQITMGHANGVVTINVTEADDLIRLQRRRQLGERYRSMVGHFRHELAHFFFERLSAAPDFQPAFREIFGDERADYGQALQNYYAAPHVPSRDYITPYASAHPHEDWAETVAHLLHQVDFTDSFVSSGLGMPGLPDGYAPYAEDNTERLLTVASGVAIAVNDINRALDNEDLYPFVLTPPVRRKIGFAHGWMKNHLAARA